MNQLPILDARVSETRETGDFGTSALVDRFGRVHRSLRISVTDTCNIRCQYCMPAEGAQFLKQERLLSFEHIARFARVCITAGLTKIRITGGEPLMRPNLHELIGKLSEIQGLADLAITTNGMFLAEQIDDLVGSGLKRLNISLDTLSEATFQAISRRPGLNRVLEGIQAAQRYPNLQVRLNALILREVNFDDIIPLAEFARSHQLALRFIEFMPLDAERSWQNNRVVSGAELRTLLESRFGPLHPMRVTNSSQPSTDYRFQDGKGVVGFIDSVTQPFCGNCDRLRLTAEGRLRNCLFGHQEWDVSDLLRDSQSKSEDLLERLRECVQHKHAAHGISQTGFQPPERPMYRIGG